MVRSRGDETRVLKPLASEDRTLSVRGEHLICTKNTRGGRVFLSCLFASEDEALLVGRGGMHPDVRNPLAARKSLETIVRHFFSFQFIISDGIRSRHVLSPMLQSAVVTSNGIMLFVTFHLPAWNIFILTVISINACR